MTRLFYSLMILIQAISGFADATHKQANIKVQETKRETISAQDATTKRQSLNQPVLLMDTPEQELLDGLESTIEYMTKTAKSLPKESSSRQKIHEKILNLMLEQAIYKKNQIYWQKILSYGQQIQNDYPNATWLDKVFYQQAVALQFLNREEDASRLFSKILSKYPESSLKGESLFSMAEFHFHQKNFSKAKYFYEQALEKAPLKRKVWTKYKLGWCLYNLGSYEQSLSLWKETIDLASRIGASGRGIAGEALHDMVYAYVETSKPKEAMSYIIAHSDRDNKIQALMFLGSNLASRNKFADAVSVYKFVLDQSNSGFDFVDIYAELLSSQYNLRDYDSIWAGLSDLLKRFQNSNPNKQDPKSLDTAKKIQNLSLYYPKLLHKEAQKSNNQTLWTEARRGYLDHLARYPKSFDYAEANRNLGDVAFKLKKYSEAGAAFAKVAVLGPSHAIVFDASGKPNENIYESSAQSMLASYSKDFESEYKQLIKEKPNFSKPPNPKTQKSKNFILACDAYMKWFPKDLKKSKDCDLYKSEIEFRTNTKPQAIEALKTFVLKYSDTPEGATQAETLMSIVTDDKELLINTAQELLKFPSLSKGTFGAKLQDLMKNLKLDQIASEASGLKRAALLENFASAHTSDKNADKIFYKAANEYLKAFRLAKAQLLFERVVREYQQSDVYADAVIELAKVYEKSFNLKAASDSYGLFIQKFPSHPSAKTVTQKRCLLLIELKDTKFFEPCSALMASQPKIAAGLWMNALDSAWMEADTGLLTSASSLPVWSGGGFTVSQRMRFHYYFASISPSWSTKAATLATNPGGNLEGEALRFAGEILFRNVQDLLKQSQSSSLVGGSVANLQGSIEKWTGTLARSEKGLAPLFTKLKDAYWSSAGFYELARGYEAFAKALQNPPRIPEAGTDAVKAQLKVSADQVAAKAQEYFDAGKKLVRDYPLYSEYTRKWQQWIAATGGGKRQSQKSSPTNTLKDSVSLWLPASLRDANASGGL